MIHLFVSTVNLQDCTNYYHHILLKKYSVSTFLCYSQQASINSIVVVVALFPILLKNQRTTSPLCQEIPADSSQLSVSLGLALWQEYCLSQCQSLLEETYIQLIDVITLMFLTPLPQFKITVNGQPALKFLMVLIETFVVILIEWICIFYSEVL